MKTFAIELQGGAVEYPESDYVEVLEAGALEFYNDKPVKLVAMYAPHTWIKVRELSEAEAATL